MAQANKNKCGFVSKEGAKFLNWKKRFMVIEPDQGRMSYYVKDDKKVKKGEILFKTIKQVKVQPDYKGKKFVFGIVTTTGRTFFVQAADDSGVDSWMASIKLACGLGNQSLGNASNSSPALISSAPATKVCFDDFAILKVIGRGGFGRVLLVRKKDTKQVYAMKVLKKATIAARGEIEHTRTEQSVLSKLDNPFLARLHWSFQNDDSLFFIMDFINGGELFHHLSKEKCFSEDRAKFYAAQIVAGMEYLHSHGIIYRDLKPENILLSHKGNVIMTDFGLSKEGLTATDSRTATFCGTPEYLAPEIIKGDDYTKAIDWWSVGTLIYEMLTGLPPFYTEDEENMYHKIMTAELKIPPSFSPEVSDIISKFLKRDPKQRLQEASQIKAHPWFASIDWKALENLQIAPPFVPQVRGEDDVYNIDAEFLNEDVKQEDEIPAGAPNAKDAFQDFTFASK